MLNMRMTTNNRTRIWREINLWSTLLMCRKKVWTWLRSASMRNISLRKRRRKYWGVKVRLGPYLMNSKSLLRELVYSRKKWKRENTLLMCSLIIIKAWGRGYSFRLLKRLKSMSIRTKLILILRECWFMILRGTKS